MIELLSERICHIYLIYGLGFFVLGLAVALEAGRSSDSRFSRAMIPLALFGLLHGLHEWIEMFVLVSINMFDWTPPMWEEWARLGLVSLSFASLASFGIQMLYINPNRPSGNMWATWAILTLSAAGVLGLGVAYHDDPTQWLSVAETWTRYTLAIPASLLAAAALYSEWRQLRRSSTFSFANSFLGAAIIFVLYGLVGLTLAPHSLLFPTEVAAGDLMRAWTGIPIQLLRSVFVLLMAYFIIRGMRTFEMERQKQLAEAQAQARDSLERRDAWRGELLRRTVAAQEEERTRLARDLHDDTLQVLTGLATGLKGTEGLLAQDPELARDQLTQLSDMSAHAIEEVRRMIHGLRPSLLDDMGLVPAVQWYAQQSVARTNTQVDIDATGIDCRLPDEVETILFRIAQEGLNNVARHARASHVRVRLACNGASTQLNIEDDGIGFDPTLARHPDANQPGWGLAGIQERVNLAGGQFSIDSSLGNGTRLQVTVPTSLASDQ